MRYLLVVLLTLCIAGAAGAVGIGNLAPQKGDEPTGQGFDGREGGENFGDAYLITGLPFSDTGATCDNSNDITLSCAASNANDVVYRYVATSTAFLTVSLCGSGYDSALGIYNSSFVEIACNDDFCGLQSQIDFSATAGQTYYFVVDGFSTNCGNYTINVTGGGGVCDSACPPNAELEGEPPCGPNYTDNYNGGCNSVGYQLICPQTADGAVLCGKSGTYSSAAGSSRDTDWFSVWGTGGTMTATLCADFPSQLLFIYVLDCFNPLYDAITGQAGQEISLSRSVPAGVEAWIWVGPSVFDGVPCESSYLLTMEGISATDQCEPSPTENSSLGQIKNQFK